MLTSVCLRDVPPPREEGRDFEIWIYKPYPIPAQTHPYLKLEGMRGGLDPTPPGCVRPG